MRAMSLLPLLAAVSEPAPAGRSSSAGIAIILLCLAVGVFLVARAGLRGSREKDGADGDGPVS